jgi:uncharacterized protein (TIGR02145 family)
MKKLKLFIAAFTVAVAFVKAQTPDAFNYQAVARTSAGTIMSSQNIAIQMSILDNGTAIYTEAHSVNTNQYGLFTIGVGQGTVSLGDFSTIDWTTGNYSLKVEMDENGGTNYTLMGTSSLLTVPYAMHAKTAENVEGLDAIVNTLIETVGFAYTSDTSGFIKDVEDNRYKIVKIGSQWWMAENLRTTKFNNGTSIPKEENNAVFEGLTTPAFAWYDNDSLNSYTKNYGSLYNYYAVNTGNLCPTGWHVPDSTEFNALITFVEQDGYVGLVGEALKATTFWSGGSDVYGFAGIDAGGRFTGDFNDGSAGYFWASDLKTYWLNFSNDNLNSFIATENRGFSVRCIKD